ncbi:MAG TPA: cohesin domain-containing protein [Vicinamibacteria bacterium]|nr:cohesin domain-containing protein [Vicinamibacteria bacterium]
MGSLGRLFAVALALSLAGWGCAARSAYRQGQKEAKKGNWDLAVARLTAALQKDPENIDYKIALENARVEASRFHHAEARKHLAADELEKAADELEIATRYDPGDRSASDDLIRTRDKIRAREEEKKRLSEFEAMKSRAQAARVPVPVLSPRSPVPVAIKFTETSLEKILDTLGKLSGVNILFDEGYRDKKYTVNLTGVTFQEALDQITFVNRLFYKVLDQNTIIIVPESPQKRRTYDDFVLRTFYLQNADVNETLNQVKTLAGITKATANKDLAAITVIATPDKVALAERIVEANDKPKGEIMAEIQILEVDRTKVKDFGIRLSNYEVSATFSPTGAAGEVDSSGFTHVRAQLLSSLNLADFVVNVPSTIFAKFLQTDTNARILAAPKLRAAEGKMTALKIGQEVPVPVTTFTATATGGTGTFAPATSFQYRNVGVTLELTPKVNASGDIALELTAEFSILGANADLGGQTLPTFLTRSVKGILRLRDGETSLIGGLVQGRETTALSGVIGLQSVPILNRIFTSTVKNIDDLEIIISITAHLVRGPKLSEEDLRSTYVGTEETVKVPSIRPPLFGAPEPVPPPGPAPRGAPRGAPAAPPEAPPAPAPSPGPPGASPSPEPPEVQPPDARPTTALFSPPEASVKAGQTTALSLVVVGARDLRAVEAVFVYDPALLEAVDIAPGSLLTLDGANVAVEKTLESGRARIRFTRAVATAGSGEVAVATFRGLRPGAWPVGVESLILATGAAADRPAAPSPGRLVVMP